MYVEFVLAALLSCIDADSYLSDSVKYQRVVDVIKGLSSLCYLENMKCEVDDDSSC